MRGVRWHAAGDVRLEELGEPGAPAPGQAVVEVACCGICGSDVSEVHHGPQLIRPTAHPLTGAAPPLVLGHEFSGRVVAVGEGGPALAPGTRVTVDPCWRCGTCFACVRGDYHLCRHGGAVGLASDGALATRVVVPAEGLIPLPDSVDDRLGALTEPLAVALHALDRAGLEAGETLLIAGFGPIGAAVLLVARTLGAGQVIVSEPVAARRERALALGATLVVDPRADDLRKAVRGVTGGVGADRVVECSGRPQVIAEALQTLRRGGRMAVASVVLEDATVPLGHLVLFERELVGTLGYRHDLPRVVALVGAGLLDPSPLVTSVVALDDAPATLLALARGERPDDLKILVDVGGSA